MHPCYLICVFSTQHVIDGRKMRSIKKQDPACNIQVQTTNMDGFTPPSAYRCNNQVIIAKYHQIRNITSPVIKEKTLIFNGTNLLNMYHTTNLFSHSFGMLPSRGVGELTQFFTFSKSFERFRTQLLTFSDTVREPRRNSGSLS